MSQVKPWARVALAMFAVGWGANQFSTMLIVYRHALGLGPSPIAGLFAIYAAALIPGLLIGGPASDRLGRRAVVIPFTALSPLATLILVVGHDSVAALAAGRALAGLCSGTVFGAATAWVRDVSQGSALSARRTALALSAGFGLGPVVAGLLAQWAPGPLVVPYLPHLAIGVAALLLLLPTPDARPRRTGVGRRRAPAALRSRTFWLTVAPAAPVVFGSVSVAIVVLPEEVTSARTLSAAFAALMTALAFAAGIGVQPLARRVEERRPGAAILAGLAATAAGAALGAGAVAMTSRLLAAVAAVLLGLGYGLCLVSGLHQAEQLAGEHDRGAVVACYYVLAYLGFAVPYVVNGLNAPLGQPGTLAVLAAASALLFGWLAVQRRWSSVRGEGEEGDVSDVSSRDHARALTPACRRERVSWTGGLPRLPRRRRPGHGRRASARSASRGSPRGRGPRRPAARPPLPAVARSARHGPAPGR
jgi:MFS family permease